MKKIALLLLIAITFTNCKAQENAPTLFSEDALADIFIDQKGNNITFLNILNQHKGKQIVIDIWASWCSDCIKGMPKVKALQQENKDVVFIFLSLDKSIDNWKKGIKKHNVTGNNYYMQSGWKGAFGTFLDLDWIPRYMVINENQNITVFKAITADDKNIKASLIK